ncbi:hypothetical protein BK131_01165 [Paenibacillus amylolyticus]|uniref:Uncharacterized protein n=1 Tax=Paenibacillus amylolyticus TaxID=1451 RepID=A0A1R1C3N7_PAEAM|nr:hypothetical protein [Paenibacillus amylolyticus]OMF16637.1 hypothetical protein BK131_01165 [Paenibacillus amylolyticus]
MLLLIIVAGCSSPSKEIDPIQRLKKYDTVQEAILQYVNSYHMTGPVAQISTGNEDRQLVFTESSKRTYSIGELIEVEGQYAVAKLSAAVRLSELAWARWSFPTLDEQEYTITISNEEEPDFAEYIKEFGLYVHVSDVPNDNNLVTTSPNIINFYHSVDVEE